MGHPSVGPRRLARRVSAATHTSSHSGTAAAALAPRPLAYVSAARRVGLRVRHKEEEEWLSHAPLRLRRRLSARANPLVLRRLIPIPLSRPLGVQVILPAHSSRARSSAYVTCHEEEQLPAAAPTDLHPGRHEA